MFFRQMTVLSESCRADLGPFGCQTCWFLVSVSSFLSVLKFEESPHYYFFIFLAASFQKTARNRNHSSPEHAGADGFAPCIAPFNLNKTSSFLLFRLPTLIDGSEQFDVLVWRQNSLLILAAPHPQPHEIPCKIAIALLLRHFFSAKHVFSGFVQEMQFFSSCEVLCFLCTALPEKKRSECHWDSHSGIECGHAGSMEQVMERFSPNRSQVHSLV